MNARKSKKKEDRSMKALKGQGPKAGGARCAPVPSAESGKNNSRSTAVRRVAAILLGVAWGMSSPVAAQQGDTCRLTFSGTGIEYIAERGAKFGSVLVTLDNGPAQAVSLEGSGAQQVVYRATDLTAGGHTLTLVCQGGGCINVDAFNVLNGRIEVEGFDVDSIGVDAINVPVEPVKDPEDAKPKSRIDKIRHLEASSGDLEKDFGTPPDSARMWTWWFWLGDRVDEKSITADLEALKAQGMGGVTVYSISGPGVPGKGPNYMSPEWRGLFRHTLREADRLGLGVSAMLCSGWNAGGPWITPEQACKQHVSSELVVTGPQHFQGALPQPAADPRFYRDVAVQAFPVGEATPGPVISASSSHARYPVSNAGDGDGDSFWVSNGENPNEGPSKEEPEWLLVDLGESRTVGEVTIQQRPGYGPRDAELQISNDGRTFTTLEALSMERDKPASVEPSTQPARYLRLWITSTWSPESENVQVCELKVDGKPIRQKVPSALMALKALSDSVNGQAPTRDINEAVRRPLPAEAPGTAIDPRGVIDLTARVAGGGILDWEVPAGQWKVLRTGCTLTGAMTSWSSPTGIGLESNPLDADAMDFQFANAAAPLVEDAGPLAGRVFRSLQIDSWEINHPNWTDAFPEDFRKLRGYDPLPYLPTLAGHLVGDAEVTDRFLYDYRRTVGDLVAEDYFGHLGTLARGKGILQQSEAGGVCSPKSMALDCLKNLGRCDIPMGEFWQDGTWVEEEQNKNGKQTASAAHLYGKRIVAAEAFTSFLHWLDSPATLKPTADRAFCEGFNHFFIFSSATRSEDGLPGTEFCAGTHFNRKVTWWNQARGFSDYIARCSHLLQQGLFVADVLFYNGDACPNFVPPKHVDPSLGPGYDYDACNSEIIMTRLAVKDGRIVLPDGMTYRLLVLPESSTMPLEVLAKLKELVAAGMTLAGPRPDKAPGLKEYPECDRQVKAMADELWGDCDGTTIKEYAFGKGRVVWGKTIRELLDTAGVKPDLTYAGARPDAFLDWIHRSVDGTEVYFIANRMNRAEKASCTFRVSGKQPELWDPVTGTRRDLPQFDSGDGCTKVPLEFGSNESMFVVFRARSQKPEVRSRNEARNFPYFRVQQEISGPWTVRFDPQWFYPLDGLDEQPASCTVVFDKLEDWAKRPEPAIRHFSGTAVYRITFGFPGSSRSDRPQSRMYLELGAVKELARVRLNGKDLGVVWCQPWRVEITGAIKLGENELEIDVVNLWPNRLAGDGKLPVEQRRTQTNFPADPDQPLLSSGLLGPVRVTAATPNEI